MVSTVLVGARDERQALAAANLSFGFNSGYTQPANGGGASFTTVQAAQAASDIASNAPVILRFTIQWQGVQPYCLDALGRQVSNNPPYNNRAQCATPVKEDFNWNHLQDDLDSINGTNGPLQSGRVKLLPILEEAPTWAWGLTDIPDPSSAPGYDPNHPVMPPGDDSTALAWWKQFAADTVAWLEGRYGAAAVAGIEIWNEENYYPVSWSEGTSPDPVRFTRLLCNGFWGVWQGDQQIHQPMLPVIFGGLAEVDTNYLSQAYAAYGKGTGSDIRSCMNSIGVHPYNFVSPNWVSPDTAGAPFANAGPQLSQVACQYYDCGRPISITEFGYPVAAVPEQNQADWDSKAYTLAAGTANVNMLLIHSLFDGPTSGAGDSFGVCASPGNPRPAATELKRTLSGNQTATASC